MKSKPIYEKEKTQFDSKCNLTIFIYFDHLKIKDFLEWSEYWKVYFYQWRSCGAPKSVREWKNGISIFEILICYIWDLRFARIERLLNKNISARDDDDRGEEGGRQRGRVDEGLQRAGRRRKRIHHAERGQKSLQKTGRQIQYPKG